MSTVRGDILQAARAATEGDRNDAYGDPTPNHENIARFWNAYLESRKGGPLSAEDVALMLGLMKVARCLLGTPRQDNYVDGAAYFAIAGEIRERQRAV